MGGYLRVRDSPYEPQRATVAAPPFRTTPRCRALACRCHPRTERPAVTAETTKEPKYLHGHLSVHCSPILKLMSAPMEELRVAAKSFCTVRLVPNCPRGLPPVAWRHVRPGAFCTSLGFESQDSGATCLRGQQANLGSSQQVNRQK